MGNAKKRGVKVSTRLFRELGQSVHPQVYLLCTELGKRGPNVAFAGKKGGNGIKGEDYFPGPRRTRTQKPWNSMVDETKGHKIPPRGNGGKGRNGGGPANSKWHT